MEYLYETHMHTCQASKCSDTPGHEYIRRYQDLGYAGIIITDHFYRGNCAVDRSLPWPDFIHAFCSGYEDARNEGERLGFPVFFGWEENVDGDEYLIYGLDEQFMLQHPEMATWTRKQQYEIVHAAGGCVVQAHPFRARSYLHTIYLSPHFADGIEGINTANEPEWNSLALRYGQLLDVPMTAGSDNHHAYRMEAEKMGGVVFDKPLRDIHDYVRAILERRPFRCHALAEPPIWTENITPDLPTVWLDENEQPADVNIMDFLNHVCPMPPKTEGSRAPSRHTEMA